MNEIYTQYWNLLHNFFFPSVKLIRKERQGKRLKKIYDSPKTPCQRGRPSGLPFALAGPARKGQPDWIKGEPWKRYD